MFDFKNALSYLIKILTNNDEIMIRLNNNRGLVGTHFERIKKHNIKLTTSIDLTVASYGYFITLFIDT